MYKKKTSRIDLLKHQHMFETGLLTEDYKLLEDSRGGFIGGKPKLLILLCNTLKI